MSQFERPKYAWESVKLQRPKRAAWSTHRVVGGQGTMAHSSSAFAVGTGAYRSPLTASDMFTIGDARETMQSLNERLAFYLEKVRSLDQANSKLEQQIFEVLEKRGAEVNDYSRYSAIAEDLRRQVLEMILGNESLVVRMRSMNSEAEEVQRKLEMERSVRLYAESDTADFRNVQKNIAMVRMKLERDIQALNEELILLKKRHEEDVRVLQIQINQSGVQVDVAAPIGNYLGETIEEIRAKFEKIIQKNEQDMKVCHDLKVSEVETAVSESTVALQEAQTKRKEALQLSKSLEIEIQSRRNLKASLEGTLRDTELRYGMEMEKYNAKVLQLEAEVFDLRGKIQQQTLEYDVLLNLKVKLEAEIATYRRLLDSGDFKLEDALY